VSRPTRYRSVAAGLVLLLGACGGQVHMPRNTGLYLLIDTSGTYNRQVTKAEQIILVALSRLQPSDSFAVARIDTASFTEKNIIAKATFDDRPSTANQQKRAFASRVEKFIDESAPAPYTDITGGLLQAIEFLKEKNPGRKEILIFSDMKEDLAKGYVRDIPLDDFRVGMRLGAQWKKPKDRSVAGLDNRGGAWEQVIDRWVPTGEPDLSFEAFKEHTW